MTQKKTNAAVELGTSDFWKRLKDDPARLAAEVCMVDIVNLDATLQHHPALRAWVNASHEVARIQEERLKWEETKTRARVYMEAHNEPDPVTNKTKTMATLEAEVDLHPHVQIIVKKLLEQQATRAAFRAMSNALEDRLQMLIQIAAKQRKELQDYRT